MTFQVNFSIENLDQCIDNAKIADWHLALSKTLPDYSISTLERVAGFISQCQHESNDFNVLQENLNYSWQGLRTVFKKYFPTDALAKSYHRQPERIANRVYANRMGNGDEASGDGWKYRGRGILQITGKSNYEACSQALFSDSRLVSDPDLLRQPDYAVLSACWFWKANRLNAICDARDVVALTKRINGGANGLEDRIEKWEHAIDVYETNSVTAPHRTMRVGSKGTDVKMLQKHLGLDQDGVFGEVTKRALIKWQALNNLDADGVAGPNTLAVMFRN